VRNLEFESGAFDDLAYWVRKDRKKALRIFQLLDAARRSPFAGIGKPEPLKYNLAKHWSRYYFLRNLIASQERPPPPLGWGLY